MEITAALVKELRERTGSGMMECKKALVEANGNIDAAADAMRKAGLAKADKKAGRIAAEGLVVIQPSPDGKQAAMVEVNSETDFVSKGDDFKGFATAVAQQVLAGNPKDLESLLEMPLKAGDPASVNTARQTLVAKLGENINVRRFVRYETQGVLGVYLHGSRIGVLVELQGGDAALAKDIAMHVAANKPVCVASADVPAELVAKEKEIFTAQAAESGKPAAIIEKMVEGRIKKFLAEVALLGQPFVKNPDITVEKLLQERSAKVIRFQRFEVGEGIEKKTENFAAEVMAQVRKS
ncbi:MAG: translation elongation factor Ts [Gammaproteobacteria bacterium]|nr:translation elongation factor Ts [Gammaproteobacteria bacterium]